MARAPSSKLSPRPQLAVVPEHMVFPPAPPHVEPAPFEPENAPPPVGEQLRRERERRGISIEAVAQMLKIRRVYLRAIEESNWAELPEPVYVSGFVRSYANFLGLNIQQPVKPAKTDIIHLPALPKLEIPKPIDDQQLPSASTIIAAVVGLFFLYALWAAIHSDSHKSTPPTAAPAATEQSSDNTPAPALLNEPALVQSDDAPAAAPDTVKSKAAATTSNSYGASTATRAMITATEDSWIQIQTPKKETIFSGVLRAGDNYHVPTDAPLLLSTTNLSGLKFELDGKAVSPPSNAENTVTAPLSLAPADFLKTASASAPVAPTPTPKPAARKHYSSARAYVPPQPRIIQNTGDAEDSPSDYPDANQ